MPSIITSLFKGADLLRGGYNFIAGSNAYSKIGDLVIDATLSEVVTLSSTITEHPIETKEAIVDHIFKNPLRVKIEGIITDTPVRIFGILDVPLMKNSVEKLINNVKSLSPFAENSKPSLQAYQLLSSIHQNRQIINVVSKLNVFNNMVIESINFSNTPESGGSLHFTAELVQISWATVKKTSFVKLNNQVSAITATTTDKGNVNKEVDTRSLAAKLYDEGSSKSNPLDDEFALAGM